MTRNNHYILVLWYTNFDEVAASVFVSELREAGLQVKVVGVNGAQAPGSHGLILASDIPMSKAVKLAHKANCVIIPCASHQWAHIQNDPRVGDLFAQIHANHGTLILGVPSEPAHSHETTTNGPPTGFEPALPFCSESVLLYPENSALPNFVRDLVKVLNAY